MVYIKKKHNNIEIITVIKITAAHLLMFRKDLAKVVATVLFNVGQKVVELKL